tara:strand:+ start:906 stop:1406 length:501 start_codon:yes stop_codon:yes gene_type:complete
MAEAKKAKKATVKSATAKKAKKSRHVVKYYQEGLPAATVDGSVDDIKAELEARHDVNMADVKLQGDTNKNSPVVVGGISDTCLNTIFGNRAKPLKFSANTTLSFAQTLSMAGPTNATLSAAPGSIGNVAPKSRPFVIRGISPKDLYDALSKAGVDVSNITMAPLNP